MAKEKQTIEIDISKTQMHWLMSSVSTDPERLALNKVALCIHQAKALFMCATDGRSMPFLPLRQDWSEIFHGTDATYYCMTPSEVRKAFEIKKDGTYGPKSPRVMFTLTRHKDDWGAFDLGKPLGATMNYPNVTNIIPDKGAMFKTFDGLLTELACTLRWTTTSNSGGKYESAAVVGIPFPARHVSCLRRVSHKYLMEDRPAEDIHIQLQYMERVIPTMSTGYPDMNAFVTIYGSSETGALIMEFPSFKLEHRNDDCIPFAVIMPTNGIAPAKNTGVTP